MLNRLIHLSIPAISCIILMHLAAPICLSQTTRVSAIEPAFREEVNQIALNPRIISAFALIEEDAINARADLIELTEIPAPPFQEDTRGRAFAAMLRQAGVDSVWIDEVGNVIGLIPGVDGERLVVLDGHLDTVFPEGTDVTVEERGDTLFAPGIADDTRALAMLLSIARVLKQSDVRMQSDVLLVGSVGEEGLGDLRGVKHFFQEQEESIDAWISIDGGAIGRITNKGLGSYRYRVTFHGPGGHSWGAFGLANPIHAMGSAIHKFTLEADAFTRYGLRTTYNVGRITGGTSVNSVPFSATMEVDMRSVSPPRLDTLDEIFKRCMKKALEEQNSLARLGEELTIEIDKIGDRPSGELSSKTPLIQRAMAASAFLGKSPILMRGSTNANIPIALGVPAVTIGRGGKSAFAHSLDEWWLDDEGYKATQMAFLLLVLEAGLAGE